MKKLTIIVLTIVIGFSVNAVAGDVIQQWESFPSNCFLDVSFQAPSLAEGAAVTIYDSNGNKIESASYRSNSAGNKVVGISDIDQLEFNAEDIDREVENEKPDTVEVKTARSRNNISQIRLYGTNPIKDESGNVIGEYELDNKTGILVSESYYKNVMTMEEYCKMKTSDGTDSLVVVKKYIYGEDASLLEVIAYGQNVKTGQVARID